ncbi:MAG: GNAT family N-acetyltransferase [Bacteroidetes bacterium]|nr:GNAT family N-acetyltransferase [Bacteroidota bacterium]
MTVEQYGVTYTRITEHDIELIRYWRNQPFIRDTMQFTEYITAEMQQAWFKKINNKHNYYFLIETNNTKIGLVNCKDAEPNTGIAEGGIFLWDKSYWGSPIAGFAALTTLECVFEVLKSGEASMATVLKKNTHALAFNKKLGYEIIGETANKNFYKLLLTKETYFKKTLVLKNAARTFYEGAPDIKIKIDEAEYPLVIDEIINYALLQKKITG